MGGKNSFFRKPLGTGKQSVGHNPLNVSVLHSGTLGPKSGLDAWGGKSIGVNNIPAMAILKGLEGMGQQQNTSVNALGTQDILNFLKAGTEEGEKITGGTREEMGEGRANVRKNLERRLAGESAGANALRQDQNQSMKALKSQQMLQGGGSQMNVGQQQALARQNARDLANFRSNEERQQLADLSREYRGAGTDIMRSAGQYGSILVGAQQPPQMKQSQGLLGNVFGGLFG